MNIQNISSKKPETPQIHREPTTKEKIIASVTALFAIAKSIQYDIYYGKREEGMDYDWSQESPVSKKSFPEILPLPSSHSLPQLLLTDTQPPSKPIRLPPTQQSSPEIILLPSAHSLPQLLLTDIPLLRKPTPPKFEILTPRPPSVLLERRKAAAATKKLDSEAKIALNLLASEIGKISNESPMNKKTAKAWKIELNKYCTNEMQPQLSPKSLEALRKARRFMGRIAKSYYSSPNMARGGFNRSLLRNAIRMLPR